MTLHISKSRLHTVIHAGYCQMNNSRRHVMDSWHVETDPKTFPMTDPITDTKADPVTDPMNDSTKRPNEIEDQYRLEHIKVDWSPKSCHLLQLVGYFAQPLDNLSCDNLYLSCKGRLTNSGMNEIVLSFTEKSSILWKSVRKQFRRYHSCPSYIWSGAVKWGEAFKGRTRPASLILISIVLYSNYLETLKLHYYWLLIALSLV